jgi:hypothetical protein
LGRLVPVAEAVAEAEAEAEAASAYVPLQPDVISYREGKLYVVGRGASPISAVAPANSLPSAVPGLYTFSLAGCVALSREADDVSLAVRGDASVLPRGADPHGGELVGDEFWLLDQARARQQQHFMDAPYCMHHALLPPARLCYAMVCYAMLHMLCYAPSGQAGTHLEATCADRSPVLLSRSILAAVL